VFQTIKAHSEIILLQVVRAAVVTFCSSSADLKCDPCDDSSWQGKKGSLTEPGLIIKQSVPRT
jgi:hypothetical protein